MRAVSIGGISLSALVAACVGVLAQVVDMDAFFQQSPAVLARYRELPISLNTPALAPGRATLTTQAELEQYVDVLGARARARVAVRELGRSQQGRKIPILYLNSAGSDDAAVIAALGRPVIWLIGQQHGNEPAGGEALLALATALGEGELGALLDRISVVIVPRANVDGAAANKRDGASGLDLNRDHILLTLPETRALHEHIVRLPPDLIVDAHEFSVANRWIQKFGALQAADLTYLYATHPAVPPATTRMAQLVFAQAIETAAKRNGLTTFLYHTTSTDVRNKTVNMGGNAPGIARNAFGLTGAISFLIETRGVGIGMQSYQRRVATHYVVISEMLRTAAERGGELSKAVAQARAQIAADKRDLVVAHRIATVPVVLPLVDPATATDKPTEVQFTDSREVQVTQSRLRPVGYLLVGSARAALDELALMGATVCSYGGPPRIEVEAFRMIERKPVDRRAINPDGAVKVELATRTISIESGAWIVPMGQPAANRIVSALEPDSPGSFVGAGVIDVPSSENEPPIYRIAAGTKIAGAALPGGDRALCGK